MATLFKEIYNRTLPKLTEYDFLNMDESEVYSMLSDYLTPAISQFQYHIHEKDLYDMDIDLKQFNFDLTVYEIDILSNFLLIEFIDANYVRVPTLMKNTLISKDFKTYSPERHLERLMSMQALTQQRTETLLSRYSWGIKIRETKPTRRKTCPH